MDSTHLILTYDPRWEYTPTGHTPFWASLDTVEYVAGLLEEAGCAVQTVSTDEAFEARPREIAGERPAALAFWLNEFMPTPAGRDIFTASLLEKWGIAHTGPGSRTLEIGLDKEATQKVFRRLGPPTPESYAVYPGDLSPIYRHGHWEGYGIVKSLLQGNSRGLDKDSVVPAGAPEEVRDRVERIHRRFSEPVLGKICRGEECPGIHRADAHRLRWESGRTTGRRNRPLADSGGPGKVDDYRSLHAASRRRNCPLMRTYSGTDDLIRLAEMYVETLHIAWCPIPIFWFNRMDGRGLWDPEGSIREHQKAMVWYGERGIPVELNEPHHWGMRDAPDTVFVASAYPSAYNAQVLGVRDYIAQLMFKSPPNLSGAMNLAKMLAILEMIAPLEGPDFIWRQTRTGLLSYPLDLDAARAHLSASVYLQMALRPHIVHVVGHTEARHAATAEEVIEACKLARRVIENALRGQPALVEDFIVGREFHVSPWGNGHVQVLRPAEMDFSSLDDPRWQICDFDSSSPPVPSPMKKSGCSSQPLCAGKSKRAWSGYPWRRTIRWTVEIMPGWIFTCGTGSSTSWMSTPTPTSAPIPARPWPPSRPATPTTNWAAGWLSWRPPVTHSWAFVEPASLWAVRPGRCCSPRSAGCTLLHLSRTDIRKSPPLE